MINSGLPGSKFPNMQKSLVTVSGEEITKAGNFPRGKIILYLPNICSICTSDTGLFSGYRDDSIETKSLFSWTYCLVEEADHIQINGKNICNYK